MTEQISVQLMAHSSIKIKTEDCCILCDPWYMGTAFNDGWSLSPQPDLDAFDLSDVTHLWISHEHPDHMHFPTLKWLSQQLDPSKVTFLFQDSNSQKVFEALGKLGFEHAIAMEHLKATRISPNLEVFVCAHRHLDSALGVIWKGQNFLLNINDTELSSTDCANITKQYGNFPLLFNQFSIAGFEGDDDDYRLNQLAGDVLDKMVTHHKELGAIYTIPFASFMYFCCEDNHWLNKHRNTTYDVTRVLQENGMKEALLAPQGEKLVFSLEGLKDPQIDDNILESGRKYFEDFYADESIPLVTPTTNAVSVDVLAESFSKRTSDWKRYTFGYIYRKLGTIKAYITDHDTGVILNFQSCQMTLAPEITAENCDLIICSQPLNFAFALPFGVQTLGVSGRYKFQNKVPPNWMWVRIISSLYNADIYVGMKSLYSKTAWHWAYQRRKGLLSQIVQQVQRFRSR